MEQQRELRNKIYAICYHYLDPKSEKKLSPAIILNSDEYELDDLMASDLIIQAGNSIGLPTEIISLKFLYLDYFECSNPLPITLMKFADILIEIVEIYQAEWRIFKSRPKIEQEPYYTRIYSIVEKYLPLKNASFSPDMLINIGRYSPHSFKAKRMVVNVAAMMGLNQKELCNAFDGVYFTFPIEWYYVPIYVFWGVIFFIFRLIFLIVQLIFYSLKWIKTRKWNFAFPHKDTLPPLTAKNFADKIIAIWLIRLFHYKDKSKEQ